MTELCAIFEDLGLKVNFAKGKTEALLTLRGKKSRALSEKLRQPDGTRILRLPRAPGSPALRLVDCYKYLGSMICEDRSLVPEGISRASSALNAFGPIADTVLGAKSIKQRVRSALNASLVFSRLLFNVCTWSSVPDRALRELNIVYMRSLRRIAGAMRFGPDCSLSDRAVREHLGEPSIDCRLVRARLLHLCSVLRAPSPCLRAVLTVKGPQGEPLPWVRLVIDDMCALRDFHSFKLAELGDPVLRASEWFRFVRDYPKQWKALVMSFHFVSSKLDSSHKKEAIARDAAVPGTHLCAECAAAGTTARFKSLRALESHARLSHAKRSSVACFIGADALCPACGVQFSTRLRAIAHATDKRSRGSRAASCHSLLTSGAFRPIEPEELVRLSGLDKDARRAAIKRGLTQPRSLGLPSRKRPAAASQHAADPPPVPALAVPP